MSSVTAADSSMLVGGSTSEPTVSTGTLDEIAAARPPAADWSNDGRRITHVADPASNQDAATKSYVDAHGGSQTLAEVLAEGNDAGGDAITNLADPSSAQDAATKAYADEKVGSVTAADTSLVVGGTPTAPTVRTATLDVIATDHPPAADWSNNGHKIASVADPTAAQDVATKAYADAKVASVAAADTSVVVGGTPTAPTVRAATLDVIATDHPPVGDWSNNGHKITSLGAPTLETDAPLYRQTLHSPLRPTGTLYSTFDRRNSGQSTSALASGNVELYAIMLPAGITITSISFVSGSTALVSGTHQVFGLYDSGVNLLRSTSDDTSNAWAANTIKTLNLTTTFTTTYAGLYYLAILVVAATTPSLFAQANGSNTNAVMLAANQIGGEGATGQTALPNGPLTLGTLRASAYPYAYIS